jgi:hypothetical protein
MDINKRESQGDLENVINCITPNMSANMWLGKIDVHISILHTITTLILRKKYYET